MNQIADVFTEMGKAYLEKDPEKKTQLMTALQTEIMPRNLEFFVSKLNKTNTGYLVGPNLTVADLYLFHLIDMLGNQKQAILEASPQLNRLNSFMELIGSIPSISRWLKARPATAF